MPRNARRARVSVQKQRHLRQFATLGAAIEAIEPRLLLSAAPAGSVKHDAAGPTIGYAPWLADQLQDDEDDDVGPIAYNGGSPQPDAPSLSGTIEGLNFDTEASAAGFYEVPPDNSMAVGPNHVVTVVNTVLNIYTKAGVLQSTQRLGANSTTSAGSFFAAENPTTTTFDPKVIYDQYNQRWVVVSLERVDQNVSGVVTTSSRVLLAVSDDSDPNGTWFTTSINTDLNINGFDRWMDYPGFAIDSQAIYVTGNMFGFDNNPPGGRDNFAGSRLIIVNKSGFYSGGSVTSNIYNPSTAAGFDLFTIQPAHMFGTAPAGVGTFLVSSGLNDGTDNYLSVIQVNNPLSSPTFDNTFVDLGQIDNLNGLPTDINDNSVAPQKGTVEGINTNDGRLYNAVWRNNELYTANTTNPTSGTDQGQNTARWYKLDADGTSVSEGDSGIVSGEDIASGTETYFPSVNVDSANDLGISFSASGPNLYAGAYYTGRLASDPAGTTQPAGTLAAGQDFYIRAFSQFGGTRNRWGDYSSTEIDPSNDSAFYVFNQYALNRGTVLPNSGEDGRWGTRVGNFSFVVNQSISGQLYQDNNGNGTLDAGEPTLNGVTVYLDNNNDNALDAGDVSVVTSGSGNYSFPTLANGTYHLRQVLPASYIQSSTISNPVLSGSSVVANLGDFPITFPIAPATGSGNDNYTVSLDGTGSIEQISDSSTTYTIAKSQLSASVLTFNGNAGDDTLTINAANGSPVPTPGVTFNGGANTSGDTLAVVGASGADTFTLNSASAFLGGATISFNAVESFSFNGTGGGDTVTVNANTLLFPATQVLSSLSLANNTTARLTSGANKILVVTNLNIGNGAVLDLTDEDAIVKNGSLSPITTFIANGYNNGAWNGTGGISSSTAAAVAADSNNPHKTALGFALGSATALGSSFDGQTLQGADIAIRYTSSGDANLDGNVSTPDFMRLASNFGGSGKTWSQADFTFNGVPNALDFNTIASNYGQVLPAALPDSPFSGLQVSATTGVDEPVAAVYKPSLWNADGFAKTGLASDALPETTV